MNFKENVLFVIGCVLVLSAPASWGFSQYMHAKGMHGFEMSGAVIVAFLVAGILLAGTQKALGVIKGAKIKAGPVEVELEDDKP